MQAHVVHVSPDLERPVPKSVAMLLGKLEVRARNGVKSTRFNAVHAELDEMTSLE